MTNQVARRDNAGREFGVICLSVSVCVCWSRPRALHKRLNDRDAIWAHTRMGPRSHVLIIEVGLHSQRERVI